MFDERLKELRKEHKMTQNGLASRLGITQQAVGRWESGLSAPDPETLVQLAGVFDVTVDDLLGRAPTPRIRVAPYTPPAESLVPVVGTVRAGYGALAFEEDYGTEPAGVRDPENYFYLVVKGDSMEPRIQDGDLALVRKQPTLDNGDLGVVVFGEGEGTLKQFAQRGSAVLLQPFNQAYDTMVITGEDLDHLHIAGKVVETKAKW
ncbi:XRE family transcriptional regulator [Ruminococcaceae bacterium OttesenSCG-928-D13]|nr:XRE family transcriptional regulator [Ruminococcaceae bacterium OttesenSCG-928-D13]